jgi:hypothetical protein
MWLKQVRVFKRVWVYVLYVFVYCVGYFIKWTEVQNLEYLSNSSQEL